MKIACFQNLGACGARRAHYHFAKELKARGHTIDFYSFEETVDGLFSLETIADHTYTYRGCKYDKSSWLKPYFVRVYARLARNIYIYTIIDKRYRKIAADIDARGYDLVFVHNCVHTQAPFLLRYLKTTPSIYYAHEPLRIVHDKFCISGFNYHGSTGEGVLKRVTSSLYRSGLFFHDKFCKKYDRVNILSADFVFTNSYFTNECVFKAYGILSRVNYPGIDINYFKPLGLPRENFILSVGGITPHKKHDFVIDSLALIEKDHRPKLIVVGTWGWPEHVRYLAKRAEDKGVELEFKRLISDEVLLDLYNRALAVVFTPLMEPLGLVPLEAMACGTPVIAVKEGGLRETIIDGETGIFVERSEAQCAKAIKQVIEQPQWSKTLGDNGREYISRHWSVSVCTDRLESNFKDILLTT